jgi:outer membrane protein TolC
VALTYNDFVVPFDVSYQADVWGRVRKTVESYREQAQASAADLATVNLSMHADLAVDYFQARSLRCRGTAPELYGERV